MYATAIGHNSTLVHKNPSISTSKCEDPLKVVWCEVQPHSFSMGKNMKKWVESWRILTLCKLSDAVKLTKWLDGGLGRYGKMSVEKKIIVAVSGIPLLYNPSLPDYKDKDKEMRRNTKYHKLS